MKKSDRIPVVFIEKISCSDRENTDGYMHKFLVGMRFGHFDFVLFCFCCFSFFLLEWVGVGWSGVRWNGREGTLNPYPTRKTVFSNESL